MATAEATEVAAAAKVAATEVEETMAAATEAVAMAEATVAAVAVNSVQVKGSEEEILLTGH